MLSGSLRDAMASMLDGNPSFFLRSLRLVGVLRFWDRPFKEQTETLSENHQKKSRSMHYTLYI